MKIAGYIIAVLGILSFIGALLRGHNFTGPVVLISLGVFLIIKANKKKDEKDNFNQWNKSN